MMWQILTYSGSNVSVQGWAVKTNHSIPVSCLLGGVEVSHPVEQENSFTRHCSPCRCSINYSFVESQLTENMRMLNQCSSFTEKLKCVFRTLHQKVKDIALLVCWLKKGFFNTTICSNSAQFCRGICAGADPGFWSGGPVEFCPQRGPEPKICSK